MRLGKVERIAEALDRRWTDGRYRLLLKCFYLSYDKTEAGHAVEIKAKWPFARPGPEGPIELSRKQLDDYKVAPEEGVLWYRLEFSHMDTALSSYHSLVYLRQRVVPTVLQRQTQLEYVSGRHVHDALFTVAEQPDWDFNARPAFATETREEEYTEICAQAIVSDNVVRVEMTPPIKVPLGPTMLDPNDGPPEPGQDRNPRSAFLMRAFDALDAQFPHLKGQFLTSYKTSWLSGGYKGVLKSLKQMVQPETNIKENYRVVTTAIVRILAQAGYCDLLPDDLVTMEYLDGQGAREVDVSAERKAGFHSALEGVDEGVSDDGKIAYTLKFSSRSFTKEEMHYVANSQVDQLMKTIESDILAGKEVNPDLVMFVVYKLAAKIEVKQPGDDVEKTRTFMITPMFKQLCDKFLLGPFWFWLRGKAGNAVGTNWTKGGADEFAKEMHADDPNRRWAHFDASKFDHCLKSGILVLITLLSLLAYKKVGTLDDFLRNKVGQKYTAASASNIAVHFLTWMNQMRIVIGELLSGEYMTANANTFYLMLALMGFSVATGDRLKKAGEEKLAKEYLADRTVKMKCQGDDGVMTWPDKYSSFHNLKAVKRYLLEYWGITLKESASFETASFYSDIDPMAGMVHNPEKGVVFLKRRFFKAFDKRQGCDIALCFRPLEDYMVRLSRTAAPPPAPHDAESAVHEALYYRTRWRGLMQDTMGTNVMAYNLFKYLMIWVDTVFPQLPHIAEDLMEYRRDSPRWLDNMRDYLKKVSPEQDIDWARVPGHISEIRNEYLPDHHVLEVRRNRRCTPMVSSSKFACMNAELVPFQRSEDAEEDQYA